MLRWQIERATFGVRSQSVRGYRRLLGMGTGVLWLALRDVYIFAQVPR